VPGGVILTFCSRSLTNNEAIVILTSINLCHSALFQFVLVLNQQTDLVLFEMGVVGNDFFRETDLTFL